MGKGCKGITTTVNTLTALITPQHYYPRKDMLFVMDSSERRGYAASLLDFQFVLISY